MRSLIIPVIIILPMLLCLGVISVARRLDKDRVNPLTKKTRRPPGHCLGKQLGNEQLDLLLPFMMIIAVPLISYAAYLGSSRSHGIIYFCILISFVGIAWSLYSIIKRWKKIQKLRLGYECELAVGQELNLLMLQGFHVFHDLQFDKFNIDHVVVGLNGVFAVETKGRSKRKNSRADGKEEYNLTYENGVLCFPGWQEDEPAKQADRQAKYLSEWLTGAVGFAVKATPVLVLPGWYIYLKNTPVVPALAIGAIPGFFKKYQGMNLNAQQLRQIVFQLDNKSRDIPPGEMTKLVENS